MHLQKYEFLCFYESFKSIFSSSPVVFFFSWWTKSSMLLKVSSTWWSTGSWSCWRTWRRTCTTYRWVCCTSYSWNRWFNIWSLEEEKALDPNSPSFVQHFKTSTAEHRAEDVRLSFHIYVCAAATIEGVSLRSVWIKKTLFYLRGNGVITGKSLQMDKERTPNEKKSAGKLENLCCKKLFVCLCFVFKHKHETKEGFMIILFWKYFIFSPHIKYL